MSQLSVSISYIKIDVNQLGLLQFIDLATDIELIIIIQSKSKYPKLKYYYSCSQIIGPKNQKKFRRLNKI